MMQSGRKPPAIAKNREDSLLEGVAGLRLLTENSVTLEYLRAREKKSNASKMFAPTQPGILPCALINLDEVFQDADVFIPSVDYLSSQEEKGQDLPPQDHGTPDKENAVPTSELTVHDQLTIKNQLSINEVPIKAKDGRKEATKEQTPPKNPRKRARKPLTEKNVFDKAVFETPAVVAKKKSAFLYSFEDRKAKRSRLTVDHQNIVKKKSRVIPNASSDVEPQIEIERATRLSIEEKKDGEFGPESGIGSVFEFGAPEKLTSTSHNEEAQVSTGKVSASLVDHVMQGFFSGKLFEEENWLDSFSSEGRADQSTFDNAEPASSSPHSGPDSDPEGETDVTSRVLHFETLAREDDPPDIQATDDDSLPPTCGESSVEEEEDFDDVEYVSFTFPTSAKRNRQY